MCVTNSLLRKNRSCLSFGSLRSSAFPAPRNVPSSSATVQPLLGTGSVESHLIQGTNRLKFKRRPKRFRKPQKPGKTAKNQERQFVMHSYHDHAFDNVSLSDDEKAFLQTTNLHDNKMHFPMKLHKVLDEVESEGLSHIVSWMPHGRCFVIHQPKEFTEHVMGKYFRQSKLTSFQRQLNLYGFQRITRGKDAGGYYNEHFLRGKAALCKRMTRVKVKGTRYKAASNPGQEPDFYSMPFVSPDSVLQSGMLTQASQDQIHSVSPLECFSTLDARSVSVSTGRVSPVDDFPGEPMQEADTDVLMSLPMIKSVQSDLFQPVPLDSLGTPWNREVLPLVDETPGETLSPEIADFCSDWVKFSAEENVDFGNELQYDNKLASMIEILLEE